MEFFKRAPKTPVRLGILPGTFNPVTVAHLSLARAALALVDEVVFVLPRLFPHKHYSGAPFEDRIAMLCAAAGCPRFSVAASDAGLYVDIAAECRAVYGDSVRLACICGRDAAERILSWNYGRPGVADAMLRDFDLLVAARVGEYTPPPEWQSAIRTLPLPEALDHVSASGVRDRVAAGEPWEHLVPTEIRSHVRRIYTPAKRT